jgi:hypothetical protein
MVEVLFHAFLNLALDGGWMVSSMPRPLYPWGKSPRYLLNRRLGGPQFWSERDGKEKNSHLLPGKVPWFSSPYPSRYTHRIIPSSFNMLSLLFHVLHYFRAIFFMSNFTRKQRRKWTADMSGQTVEIKRVYSKLCYSFLHILQLTFH